MSRPMNFARVYQLAVNTATAEHKALTEAGVNSTDAFTKCFKAALFNNIIEELGDNYDRLDFIESLMAEIDAF